MIAYIHTDDGVSFVLEGNPHDISKTLPNFNQVVDALQAQDAEAVKDALEVIEAKHLAAALAKDDALKLEHGVVTFNGKSVSNTVVDRMIELDAKGFDVLPLKNFLTNLLRNPSYRAVTELYGFLEYAKMPITPDGYFLAYKAVGSNFRDIYAGTFDNSIGSVVSMPRNEVNEDSNVTCSNGLHVCSHEYLPNFAHANGHVVIVKVNPADVVAVPKDYNNTKMRVSRYEVLSEVVGWYDARRDALQEQITTGWGPAQTADEEFEAASGNEWEDSGPFTVFRISTDSYVDDHEVAEYDSQYNAEARARHERVYAPDRKFYVTDCDGFEVYSTG